MLLALLEWWYTIDQYALRRALAEVALAVAFYLLVVSAITWPVILHVDEVLVGGGELGGWLWRQWWHFQEIEAIGQADLPLWDRLSLLVSLGRYPETGNILDILVMSYPLDKLVGFPAHHNLKVLGILLGNCLSAYALARTQTNSRAIALAAGCLSVVNPLVFLDVNNTGLRQVLLWWLFLYPIALNRAWRTASRLDGAIAGALLALTAAFYWFYGLFAGMYTVVHCAVWLVRDRPRVGRLIRWILPFGVVAALGVAFFVAPYLAPRESQGPSIGGAALPELTFFLEFPSYDTISHAPLRPSSYQENVLSSLHRTIGSAWPADAVINPGHGVMALPVAAVLFGVFPALLRRKNLGWLAVWMVFYLGTLGPFLKLGSLKDHDEVVHIGDYVIRLPYAWMFQWIPGMSRMFAPYRMGSMVVVASVALLAASAGQIKGIWRRRSFGLILTLLIVLQPFYRFDKGPVARGAQQPTAWRLVTHVSAMRVPEWYAALDPNGWEALIELPLEQQQDLLYAYQMVHRRKIYRSWATPAAIPPDFRKGGGGDTAKRLRWMARQPAAREKTELALLDLSRNPLETDLSALTDAMLTRLIEEGDYRWMLVHERGYFLVRSQEGAALYRDAVRKLSNRLGVEAVEIVEHEAFDWPGRDIQFPKGPAWIPWASQEVQLPVPELPRRYFMAIFDLSQWKPADAPPVPPALQAEPVLPTPATP